MRAVRAVGGWRVASAAVGGLGALAGVAKGIFFSNILIAALVLGRFDFHPYRVLWMGLEGGTVIFSLLGLASTGLVLAGRHRTGAWIMVASAAAIAAYVVVFALVRPSLMYPLGEPHYPISPGSYVAHLFPVPLLLAGAALAFFAHRTERHAALW